jgi:hypothetical protein
MLVPSKTGGAPTPCLATPNQVLEAAAPKLSREEELFAISLADLAQGTLGRDAAVVLSGDALLEPEAIAGLLLGALATGDVPGTDNPQVAAIVKQVREQLKPADGSYKSFDGEGEEGKEEESGEGVDEIVQAVRDLTPEESEVLQASARLVADAMWERFVDRLEAGLLGRTPAETPVRAEQPVAAAAR